MYDLSMDNEQSYLIYITSNAQEICHLIPQPVDPQPQPRPLHVGHHEEQNCAGYGHFSVSVSLSPQIVTRTVPMFNEKAACVVAVKSLLV